MTVSNCVAALQHLPLRYQVPTMHCAEACRPESFTAFWPKNFTSCFSRAFAKETTKGTVFLCLFLESERLNEMKLLVIPGHDRHFQINTDSVFSFLFPHASDRTQHQMLVNICGNMQDVKHLQNLLIIFVMSKKLDIACREFPVKRNKIWWTSHVKSFNICLPMHWMVL